MQGVWHFPNTAPAMVHSQAFHILTCKPLSRRHPLSTNRDMVGSSLSSVHVCYQEDIPYLLTGTWWVALCPQYMYAFYNDMRSKMTTISEQEFYLAF